MITIAGGIYRERCMRPAWDDIYGSAGRAATAIARFGGQAELHAYVDGDTQVVMEARAAAEGFAFNPTVSPQAGVTFEYIHGLATPDIRRGVHASSQLQVTAEKVLRFGMIDGTAVVNAEYAVFDPQNAEGPESFSANGSTAKHLALVLNRHEANLLLPDSNGLPPRKSQRHWQRKSARRWWSLKWAHWAPLCMTTALSRGYRRTELSEYGRSALVTPLLPTLHWPGWTTGCQLMRRPRLPLSQRLSTAKPKVSQTKLCSMDSNPRPCSPPSDTAMATPRRSTLPAHSLR